MCLTGINAARHTCLTLQKQNWREFEYANVYFTQAQPLTATLHRYVLRCGRTITTRRECEFHLVYNLTINKPLAVQGIKRITHARPMIARPNRKAQQYKLQ